MKQVSLSEVCQITMGQAPKGSSYNTGGVGIPLLAGDGDFGIETPEPSKFTTSPTRASKVGDILLCIRASIGDRNWSDKPYCLGRGVAGLTPISDKLDGHYLWHILAVKTPELMREAKGSTFKQIGKDTIQSLKLSLPPFEEQKRIAAILDKADTIRKKRKQAIELAEQFLRSAFLDMFGDPITNPKGWEVVKLGTHIEFVTSGSRGWAKYYSQTGARFIRSLDVQMNRLGNNNITYVQPPHTAESVRTLVKPNDVLLTITGSRIGRVASVPNDIGEAYISQHVAILRVGNAIEPRFLSMFLSDSLGGQYQIASMQYGQTKPGLNLDQIRNFSLPLPPKQRQKEFCALWDKVISINSKLEDAAGLSKDHFNVLLQQVFRSDL